MAVSDDLILTLSDEDVSDEEFGDEEPRAAEVATNGTKRKRAAQKQTSVKKSKKERDELEDESDFEFETGDAGLEELDVWAFSGDPVNTKQPGDIEAIVARRRPQVEEIEDISEDDSDVEADDVSESEDVPIGVYDGLSDQEDPVEEDDGASASEDDDVVAPVAHPDDDEAAAEDDEEIDDEEAEDTVEAAKRGAFFAQETEQRPSTSSVTAFHALNLSRPVLKGLASVGFSKPTPIQSKTIPVALEGKDLVGGAVTGSGKTAAFLIPILERLLFRPKRTPTTRVAILMPTRELALQCFNVAQKLASFTDITFGQAIGGLNSREQEKQLKTRPDIVIATPGRFIDLERNSASFAVNTVEILVLDEADRMLEEGFAEELNEILSKIPKSRQTMLFSATMTSKVDDLIRVGLQRPVRLLVDAQKQTVSGLVQEFLRLRPGKEDKRLAYLMHLCEQVHTDRVIIFFRQKKEAHRVRVVFALCGFKAAELHGGMSQEQRINAIEAFRTGKAAFLLATDLASRGLDIKGIETVINYEAPQTHEIYLHRVGRTARAGRTGRSCTLAAEPDRKIVKAAVKSAKAQGAQIRQRTVEPQLVDAWHTRLAGLEQDIEDVLREEKEEKVMQQVDRELTRADNIVQHEDEIKARPKKTWFESEREKKVSRDKGAAALNGPLDGEEKRVKKKGKLSNKEKKKLLDRDDRRAGIEARKKGKEERTGNGKVPKKVKGKVQKKGKPRR